MFTFVDRLLRQNTWKENLFMVYINSFIFAKGVCLIVGKSMMWEGQGACCLLLSLIPVLTAGVHFKIASSSGRFISKIPVVADMHELALSGERAVSHPDGLKIENAKSNCPWPPSVQSLCFGYYLFFTRKGISKYHMPLRNHETILFYHR